MARNGTEQLAKDLSKGQKTREEIVDRALPMAAVGGLGAISIGRLAKEMRMSKSGLFAHFGSKENLDAAIVDSARAVFLEHILAPIETAGLEGIERVWALCDNWLQFVEKRVLPGGYFFTGAFFQYAGQNETIPTEITQIMRDCINTLRAAIAQARWLREFPLTTNVTRTALELHSILIGAQWAFLMGYTSQNRPRLAILAKLAILATDKIPVSAFESERTWQQYLETKRA